MDLGDLMNLGLSNGLGEPGETLNGVKGSSSPFQLKLSSNLEMSIIYTVIIASNHNTPFKIAYIVLIIWN